MASRQTDVTLNIRARNTAIAEVEKTLKALNLSKDALAAFKAITDKSSLSTDELKAKQKLLNDELKKLKDSSGVSSLKKLQDELSRVSKSLSESQKKLGDLRRAQVEQSKIAGPLTEKQTKSIERQSLELDRERTSVNRLKEEYAALNRVIAQAPKNLDRIIPATIRGVGSASNKISAELSSRGQVGAPIIQNGSSSLAQLAAAERKIAINARRASLQQTQFVGAVSRPGFSQFATSERSVIASAKAYQQQQAAVESIFSFTQRINAQEQARVTTSSKISNIFSTIAQIQKSIEGGNSRPQKLINLQVSADRLKISLNEAKSKYSELLRIDAQSGESGLSKRTADLAKQAVEVKRLEQEYAKLDVQITRSGGSVRKSGISASLDEQRSALNFYQRLRGQVLSLTSAYIGLYGVINQAEKAFEDQQALVGINARFSALLETKDPKIIADKLEFVRGVANRLGIEFFNLANSYSNFAVSAKLSGASIEEIDTIFIETAKSIRKLNIDTENTKSIFLAIEQVFSKGVIATQELKLQLGQSLPGAYEAFAIQTGRSTKQLGKDLETGAVNAREFIKFIVGYAASLGTLGPELNSSSAELNRFKNEFAQARNEFEKELDPLLAQSLKDLTTNLKDPKIRESIKGIGKSIGELISFIVKYKDEIGNLIKGVAYYLAGSAILGGLSKIIAGFIKWKYTAAENIDFIIEKLGKFASKLAFLLPYISKVSPALYLLGSGYLGFEFGKWLEEHSEKAERFGVVLSSLVLKTQALFEYFNGFDSEKLKKSFDDIDAFAVEQFKNSYSGSKTERKEKATADSQKKVSDSFNSEYKKDLDIAATFDKNKTYTEEYAKSLEDAAERLNQLAEARTSFESNPEKIANISANVSNLTDKLKSTAAAVREQITTTKGLASASAELLKQDLLTFHDAAIDGALDEAQKKFNAINYKYDKAIIKLKNDLKDYEKYHSKADSKKQRALVYAEIKNQNKSRNQELSVVQKQEIDKLNSAEQARQNKLIQLQNDRAAFLKDLTEREIKLNEGGAEDLIRSLKIDEINKEYEALEFKASDLFKNDGAARLSALAKLEEDRQREFIHLDDVYFKKFDEKVAERDRKIQRIQSKVEAGSIDPKRGQQQINQIYADARPQLQKIADILKTLPGYTDELKDKVEDVLSATTKVVTTFGVAKDTLQETAASGLTDAFFGWTDGINSAGEALKKFAADFFRFIAEAIVKQEALNFVKSLTGNGDSSSGSLGTFLSLAVSAFSGSPTGAPGSGVLQLIPQTSSGAPFFDFIGSGSTSSLLNAGVRHDGGAVSSVGRSRRVDPSIFQSANARLGLGPNERAMILKTGEVVSSDREVAKRLGGIGGQAAAVPQNITVNNTVESSSIFTMGIRSRQGKLEVNNLIRADAPSIAKYLAPYLKK